MKRNLLLSSAMIPAVLATGAMGQVINFVDGNTGQPVTPAANFNIGNYYEELFAGQGAYSDPGNNIWNGYGDYGGGYGSTYVYSGSPGNGVWPEPAGNPGNPYAAYNAGAGWVSSVGTSLFEFTGNYETNGDSDSGGQFTPVTLKTDGYQNDVVIVPNTLPNGTPHFLFTSAAHNAGSDPDITFILQNVPAGAYGLCLYGASPNNNGATTFSVSSGTAHNGINSTLNRGTVGSPPETFVEGVNFVIFENVTPDGSNNITITASPNPQAGVGNMDLTNETFVNGFQLIFHPPPTALAPTAAQNVYAGQTATFTFSPAFATSPTFRWQSVIGGVTNTLSDGGSISGSGTSALTLSGVSSGEVGLYQCVITTATGTNTSPAAPLTLLTSPATTTLQAGDPTTFAGNVLRPGDTLTSLNDNILQLDQVYESVPPPFNMTVANVEDGSLWQYCNLGTNGDAAPFIGPVGFIVTPTVGATIVNGMRLFTPNTHPEDDPADYLLEGSNDGSNYTTLSGGLLAMPPQRNAAGGPINITNQVLEEINFANSASYSSYRLTFTNVNNDAIASNGLQIAEVQLLGTLAPAKPIIVGEPPPLISLLAGNSVDISIVPGGPGPLTYTWYYNTTTAITGATNATLILTNLQPTNNGTYYCSVSNPYGATNSSSVTLSVVSPTLYEAAVAVHQPVCYYPLNETSGTEALELIQGNNGTYESNAVVDQPGVSDPPFLGFPADDHSVYIAGTNADAWVSAPFGTLAGPNEMTLPNLTFTCWMYPIGTQNASLGLIFDRGGPAGGSGFDMSQGTGLGMLGYTWNNNSADTYNFVSGLTPPDQEWSLAALTIASNQAILYLLNSEGRLSSTNPIPHFNGLVDGAWRLDNDAASDPARSFIGMMNAVAVFTNVLSGAEINALYDAGAFGTTNIAPVVQVPTAPITADEGGTVTIPSTVVDGPAPYTYQWYFLSAGLTNIITGSTNSALLLTGITAAQLGDEYFVVVSNAYGAGTSGLATLNVLSGPPVLVTDVFPALQDLPVGTSVTFSVAVTGTAPFSYQWSEGATPIAGATDSSYTFDTALGIDSYSVVVTNALGTVPSSTAVVVGYTGTPPTVTFNGNGTDWTTNQGATWPGATNDPNITSNLLTLTDNTNGEACSAFYNIPQYIGAFTASFTYQAGGNRAADGTTFCLQQNTDAAFGLGTNAVGDGGGDLGFYGITNSVGFELNLYASANGGSGIQFGAEGSTPDSANPTAPYLNLGDIYLESGDPVFVQISYANSVATMNMMDNVTGNKYSTTFSANIPAIIGAKSAFVGFTAGDGGAASTQTVSNFVFNSITTIIPTGPVLSVARGSTAGAIVLSWPSAGNSGFALQQTASLGQSWTTVSQTPIIVGSDYQVTLTPGSGPVFYRLAN